MKKNLKALLGATPLSKQAQKQLKGGEDWPIPNAYFVKCYRFDDVALVYGDENACHNYCGGAVEYCEQL